MNRCKWADGDELMQHYHDSEWGVPVHDDRLLFEFLILEGAQAGLSWITILRRREHYRSLFENFEPEKIAAFQNNKIEELMANPSIIRNRLKIASVISNARAFLEIKSRYGSFDQYIWSFSDGVPIDNCWSSFDQVPSETLESKNMSRKLKKDGFRFVGPTICYAFMQAVGMVNDHTVDCFRHSEILELSRR